MGLLVYFAIGVVIGLTVFPLKWLKVSGWLQTIGISLTLFSMGVSISSSPTFLQDLQTAGMQAMVYAITTIAGSVLLVWFFSRIVFQEKKEKEE